MNIKLLFITFVCIILLFFLKRHLYNYNNLLFQIKKMLKETNGIFIEKLLLLPITPLNKIIRIKLPIHKKPFQPIILIPNIGGNKLYHNSKKIWFNNNYFLIKNNCNNHWVDQFTPDLINGQLYNKTSEEKFNIINNFGKISSITFLHKIGNSISYEFEPLLSFLTHNLNYTPKYNLFAAPYDFRIISNKSDLHPYFKKLKDLIEHSYSINNTPSIITCHGLGGILFTLFINYYLPLVLSRNNTLKWKKFFIKIFIPINTPFIGCSLAQKALEQGISEGIGLTSLTYNYDKLYHKLQKYIGGFLFLLPDPHIFKQDFSSIEIYNDFIKNLLSYRLKDPKILTKAVVSSNSNTLINYKDNLYEDLYYKSNQSELLVKLRNNTPLNKMVGDGISPFISQQVPILWDNSEIFRIQGGHRSVINTEKFLELFYEIIS